jgi:hypothetical protein
MIDRLRDHRRARVTRSCARTTRSRRASGIEDAQRFVELVRGDDPELASYLRVE